MHWFEDPEVARINANHRDMAARRALRDEAAEPLRIEIARLEEQLNAARKRLRSANKRIAELEKS